MISATAAAVAKMTKPKTGKVSHAKPSQEQTALPLPTVPGLEFGQIAPGAIVVLAQVRKEFDEAALNELAMDIAMRGIMQPLTVRYQDGQYVLVAGERRLRAAKLAQLETVPVMIANIDDQEHQLAQLAENIQREGLTLSEEAAAVKLLYDALGGLQEVGAKLHKSKAWVSKRLSLANGLGHYASALMADGITEDIELLQTVDKIERESPGSNSAWALCEKVRKGEAGRTEARETLQLLKTRKQGVEVKPAAEKKADPYEVSAAFRIWLKNPHPYAAEFVEIAYRMNQGNERGSFDESVSLIKRLEGELADARNHRDNLLKLTCKELEKFGTLALNIGYGDYIREKRK